MNNSLPIIATFLEALSFPYKYYRSLLKVGLPIIITGGVFTIFDHFLANVEGNPVQIVFYVLLIIALVLSLVMAIVGCHRIFLLGDNVIEETSLFDWTGNEIKYIGWWIFIGLCTVLIAIPFMLILMPFMISSLEGFFENQPVLIATISVINIPIYYVASRWSLVLPSSAINIHGKSLTWSWELSSGNGWRLTLLIGFLPFVTDIIFDLLPSYESILFGLLQGALWLVVGVVEVGLLSLSYKFLVASELESANKSSNADAESAGS